ncbi:MAG: 3-hydroxyacyl-CoA dehydrogenase NAD-binding domain-containing protein [Gemmatimonadetes bacterium]|nr:3-hydroxyacyl-CoA dehydrogenase NAD-binding domain-containing protein [Gemmatimonadota bacterium]
MTESTAFSLSVEDGIAVLTFDLPGESVNKFSPAVIEEFTGYLALLEQDQAVRAAVLISGKPGTFIAGADIDQFLAFRSADDAAQASAFGHTMMRRIETGRVPLVVAVEGACLGGGLEFALAAAYRLAADTPKTIFALPEIKLGLIPGAGGTQRLPRRIGVQAALDMILTGKNVRAKKAKQSGLIDEIVHPSLLREIAIRRARELAEGKIPRVRETRRRTTMSRAIDDTAVGRTIVLRQARQLAMKKSGGNYPAIPAAIDAVRAALSGSESAGYATEARLFGQLAMSPVCKELMFLFYATTALKKDAGVPEGTVAAKVDRIGVVGSGFMGAGIAAVSAQQGIPVRFKDTALDRVAAGLAAVRDVLREGLTRKHITRREYEDRVGLVSGTASYTGFGRIPLVIEAVFEDLGVKHTVVRELERVLPTDAVLATNTSTIPIVRIAEASARPERVIGMHFFSPVHKMPLLEVVVTPKTAPEVTVRAVEFGRRIGKTVIVVRRPSAIASARVRRWRVWSRPADSVGRAGRGSTAMTRRGSAPGSTVRSMRSIPAAHGRPSCRLMPSSSASSSRW